MSGLEENGLQVHKFFSGSGRRNFEAVLWASMPLLVAATFHILVSEQLYKTNPPPYNSSTMQGGILWGFYLP